MNPARMQWVNCVGVWCLGDRGTCLEDRKAVADYRSPRRWRAIERLGHALASWSAPALWRFGTLMYGRFRAAAPVILLAIAAVSASAGQEPGLGRPAKEKVASTTADPEWTRHSQRLHGLPDAQSAVEPRTAPGTRPHFERGLGRDLIRVSCAIRSTGPDATASLFVYWDASNYTQIGLNRPRVGRLEAREVLGTYAHDHDLGPWLRSEWHTVGIEVAQDC